MTEAPTGLLAWGQAAAYDAADDRAVIAAVTGGRTGLGRTAEVRAGGGLALVVSAGWVGVAACGDGTSAVVGSRLDQVVAAAPGPASGTRDDVLWCDVEPDEGQWSLAVIPAPDAAGRPGLAVAWITVPAGANTAAQMDIRPAEATLERRVLALAKGQDSNQVTGLTWSSARELLTVEVVEQPGRFYRVRFTATSVLKNTGSLEGRIGIGTRLTGQPNTTSVLTRATPIQWAALGRAVGADIEHVYKHTQPVPVARTWDAKMWVFGSGGLTPSWVTQEGSPLDLSVEDLGT
jgi:hypothetical protein